MADHHTEHGWLETSDPHPPDVSPQDARALAILRQSWGDRYQVLYVQSAEQHWQAARIGSSADYTLRSDTAEQLNESIGADARSWD
jgi:hypothetical protein